MQTSHSTRMQKARRTADEGYEEMSADNSQSAAWTEIQERRLKTLEETTSRQQVLLESQSTEISLLKDLIAVLKKGSQDWLDGEPQRLTVLDDLRLRISRLESQPQSMQKKP
jgi:hypothetical protein